MEVYPEAGAQYLTEFGCGAPGGGGTKYRFSGRFAGVIDRADLNKMTDKLVVGATSGGFQELTGEVLTINGWEPLAGVSLRSEQKLETENRAGYPRAKFEIRTCNASECEHSESHP
jgi:hypothetical protein